MVIGVILTVFKSCTVAYLCAYMAFFSKGDKFVLNKKGGMARMTIGPVVPRHFIGLVV